MRPAVFVLLAVLLFALISRADGPSSSIIQRIFVGQGRVLTVGDVEPLSLNAHVGQVLYQPGSLEAAYTSTRTDGDTVTNSVRLVGLKRGETQTLLAAASPAASETDLPAYDIVGWSGDGRYLIVLHYEHGAEADALSDSDSPVWDCVDVGVVPFKIRRIPLPDGSQENGGPIGAMKPSPSGNLFALGWIERSEPGKPAISSVFLYSPAKGTLQHVALPARSSLLGWTDETHILLSIRHGANRENIAHDVSTGKETPATNETAEALHVARAYPDVRLSLSTVPLPVPGPNPQSRASAVSLWLNVKGAKPRLPSACLALFNSADDPQTVLAPDQSSALWVQNGDLYVSRFSLDNATAREKYDAGEHLTCDEERDIAQDNAKQIGLGLLQYSQDYDEQFPPAENFRTGVSPYIKNDSLFSVAAHPFSYAAPTDLHMSAIDDVSHTVLGTITLPCAVVTLYADGHVRSLPPSSDAPAAP